MNSFFKSNGKFLLTGEYLVLKGATALALPLKLGQSLEVESLYSDENLIYWDAFKTTDYGLRTTKPRSVEGIVRHFDKFIDRSESTVNGQCQHWFSAVLSKTDFSIKSSDDQDKAKRLSDILSKAKSLNENLFTDSHDYRFSTLLDFDPQWGLGSSSTLINNVSEWADIDPYKLLDLTFNGSGYDIACAKAEGPIFYRLQNTEHKPQAETEAAPFNPPFKENLFFIYQGHKQNSSNEVKAFLDQKRKYDDEIKSISEISKALTGIKTLRDFCYFIRIHEDIISDCLGRKRLKKYFNDFEGEIKSLGAWGGDFFLVATEWDEEKVKNYFNEKGLNTVFRYNDIVL